VNDLDDNVRTVTEPIDGEAMATGSEQRRAERAPRVAAAFRQEHVEAALDLLHLADMAWHDCYGPRELELPEPVLNDILLLANGDLAALIRLTRHAVIDFRDVRVEAEGLRAETDSLRVEAEGLRAETESLRAETESLRVEADDERAGPG
jgi:hypothetical protein